MNCVAIYCQDLLFLTSPGHGLNHLLITSEVKLILLHLYFGFWLYLPEPFPQIRLWWLPISHILSAVKFTPIDSDYTDI